MALPVGPTKAIGFLTVVEHDLHGLFGGYLLLNETGRPLEFHCTAPVKPNRAQQILYGPTLKPFLYGEQIGATLVNKHAAGEWLELVVGQNRLAIARQHGTDREQIAESLAAIDEAFDFVEPFDRIREAIDEAQRTGARAA
jgi:hypothetical protein